MKRYLVVAALSSSLLTACGGGSGSGENYGVTYDGVDTAAQISSDNQSKLETAAIEVTLTASNTQNSLENLPAGAEISSNSLVDTQAFAIAQEVVEQILAQERYLPVAATQTEQGSCGGTQSVSGSQTSATIIFNNYCDGEYGGEITFNGKAVMTFSEEKTTIKYTNFKMSGSEFDVTISGTIVMTETDTGETISVNARLTSEGESFEISTTTTCNLSTYDCVESLNVEGSNGLAYKVEDLDVTEGFGSIDISAKVYEPEVGYVYLESQDIEFCIDTDGVSQLSAGSIALYDESQMRLDISITDCGVYESNLAAPVLASEF